MADGVVQQVIDAIVECLDTRAEVRAWTGRDALNVLPLEDVPGRGDMAPVLGYQHIVATRDGGAVGDWRTHTIDFVAEADTYKLARAGLALVETHLTCKNLAANVTYPLDARITDWTQTPDDNSTEPQRKRVALSVEMTVKHT